MPNVMANPPSQSGFPCKPRPVQPSGASIRKFEARIRKNYNGVVFDLTATRDLIVSKVIELTRLIVPERKRGTGTAIMRELCEFADRQGIEIRLTPASKGDYAATTSRGRLIRFYKRFGFTVRPGDLRPVPTMARKCSN